jgi:Protein of unknown function (DUF4240)
LESKGNSTIQIKLLTDWLSAGCKEEIFDFHAYRSKFSKIAHSAQMWCAANIYMDYCSDDSFDYFKAWLIAQGKDVYTQAVKDPDSLLNFLQETEKKGEVAKLEDFLFVPYEAYLQLTGKEEMEDYDDDYHSDVEIPKFPLIELDWAGNEERMRAVCPNIYAAFRDKSL